MKKILLLLSAVLLFVGCSKDNENDSNGFTITKDVECECGLIYNVSYIKLWMPASLEEPYQTYTNSSQHSAWKIKLNGTEIYPFTTYMEGSAVGYCTWECVCGNKITVFDKYSINE